MTAVTGVRQTGLQGDRGWGKRIGKSLRDFCTRVLCAYEKTVSEMIPDVSLPYDILRPVIQPPPFVPSRRFPAGTGDVNDPAPGCGSAPSQ